MQGSRSCVSSGAFRLALVVLRLIWRLMAHYFEEIKQYVKFGAADHRALRQLYPIASPSFAAIAQDFYDRLERQPNALKVFRSKEQVLRLQASLVKWMDRLLSGPWDDEYYELRSRIGKVHVQISLPQHFMFSAMALIQEHLIGIALENLGSDAELAIVAINKITNIDLAIMLDSYRDNFVSQVQAYERSEHSLLESKLEETEALYHTIFESSGVAIMVLDSNHRIRLFNAKAEEVTGFSRQVVLGQTLNDFLIHPSATERVTSLLSSLDGDEQCEVRAIKADTSEALLRFHLSAVGGTGDVCVLALDITRERKLSVQSRRVETLAALGTLAAGLAHEIRNPLNAAQLQLMLVERAVKRAGESVDAQAMESSQLVKAELTRLAGLVEDFLAFARPADLRIANADISDLCNAIHTLLDGDAKEANARLTSTIEDEMFARVDAERLKQVLINLLRNAIEAAGSGGEIEFGCERIAQCVFFTISDTGPGLPVDIDIFEPFATSKESGTGLGLPIVHRIVSDHQGTLEVERRGDKTVFTVELPVDGPHARP